MKKAMEIYTSNPVFDQCKPEYFDKLRHIFRRNYKSFKYEDVKTILENN
jgi:hypothetical protein